jgi:hypothetical protein
MKVFQNVSVVIKANVYFDGRVTSRTLEFSDGTRKTLGIMLPGEYEFNTGAPERMEITSGLVEIQRRGSDQRERYSGGELFEVEGDSSFTIRVMELTDYICSFLA